MRRSWWYRLTHFDPGLRELRAMTVAMVAVLATYGSALLVEHAADLRVDVVIQAVVLAMTMARTLRGADYWNLGLAFVVVPAVAAGTNELNSLFASDHVTADIVFVAVVALSIGIRRFGARATKIGSLTVLPLVSILVMQGPFARPGGDDHSLWVALFALIACCWVALTLVVAGLLGFVEPVRAVPWRSDTPAVKSVSRIPASTRMALQMSAALTAAFVIGRVFYADHWTWVVLTAFIVCSGARGRGDVVHKGLLRALGAALGTVVATGIAGLMGRNDPMSIVIIFAVLALATWLRTQSYAYWAACVTSVLSLLYGYYGETGTDLLQTRLIEILIGSALGIAASWLILPVKTNQVVRRRVADALERLSQFLGSPDWCEPEELARRQARFDKSVGLVRQLAGPLEAIRRLRGKAGHADAIDAVRQCVRPVRVLVTCLEAHPELRTDPELTELRALVSANVTAIRRAIGRQPGPAYSPVETAGRSKAVSSLVDIDAALGELAQVFVPVREPVPS
ncbi:FUSC family protein [Amycolatopsis sp. cg5]|uniref:FUSC family protein n=1 Tax=Amycolatopsis sp. cg5 TaxID=3238802 RepID=UPI00352425D1